MDKVWVVVEDYTMDGEQELHVNVFGSFAGAKKQFDEAVADDIAEFEDTVVSHTDMYYANYDEEDGDFNNNHSVIYIEQKDVK